MKLQLTVTAIDDRQTGPLVKRSLTIDVTETDNARLYTATDMLNQAEEAMRAARSEFYGALDQAARETFTGSRRDRFTK